MLVIGLVGGVASGKSLVASQLERLGGCRLDADRAGHEALQRPEIVMAVVKRWGSQVLDPEGRIDRKQVAKIVFAPTEAAAVELAYLERLTHPEIERLLRQQVQQCREDGSPAAVLDAAVMVKAGWVNWCDSVLFIEAPRQVRWDRARQRGWTEAEFDRREAAQTSLAEKRKAADAVIDNSGDERATFAQVTAYWESLSHKSQRK